MFANRYLTEEIEFVEQLDYASGTATRTSAAGVPTAGCEGVLFVVHHAAVAGTPGLKAIGSAASNLGSPADLAGTGQTVDTAWDNNISYIDIKGPFVHPFVGIVVTKDGVNTAAESAIAYRYGLRKQPATQPATVAGERHAAVIAGTA